MKLNCDIVKDLLFNYNDGVLSKTSKDAIEEHLKNCEDCNNYLKEIKSESKETDEIKMINSLKLVKKYINKKNTIIFIFIIIILLFIIFNVNVFKNYNSIASTMEIYLQKDITEEEITNIKKVIIDKSNNVEIGYIYENGEGSTNNITVIDVKTDTKVDSIVESIKDMKGIANIVTHLNYNPYKLFIDKILKKEIL